VNAKRSNEAAKAIANVLSICTAADDLMELIRAQSGRLQRIEAILAQGVQNPAESNCWLDARQAAAYLGFSAGTFDKYRYKTNPRIKGYPLDGKVLYKKSDLDQFVKLYAAKVEGVV
jgi:hypothetical protein